MRIIPIKSINRRAADAPAFIEFSEEEYRLGITDCALGILESEKPLVLITGPSGSGKTSTAYRLKDELAKLGAISHIISMDNYFIPLGLDKICGIDLESPDRMDKPFFKEQTDLILRGEELVLPVFDFANQERLTGARFRRNPGEIVIIEGIHALNPDVTGKLSEDTETAATVYVSIRTRIKNSCNNTLHPSKIRLMRRFVRDKLYRARTIQQTMEYFANVQRGEKLYIMPYKKYAQFDIDTFIPYEPCVYKKHILKGLNDAQNKTPLVLELIQFLEELTNVADEHVPTCSLVREFIGGNQFME